jgi:transcriptional regulator with XRE-family HTH domain
MPPTKNKSPFDVVLNLALGDELRRRRQLKKMTFEELSRKLPSEISPHSLRRYENGSRAMSVARLAEICQAIGESPVSVFDTALRKARDLRRVSLAVDLEAVLRDRDQEWELVCQWATNHRLQDPDVDVVTLTPQAVREMATMMGVDHAGLAGHLVAYHPGRHGVVNGTA